MYNVTTFPRTVIKNLRCTFICNLQKINCEYNWNYKNDFFIMPYKSTTQYEYTNKWSTYMSKKIQ
jgi:hypothetical protein